MVCILAKDPVTAKSPAYHDHLLHRILLNLLDATFVDFDRLRACEFEAAEAAIANVCPQRQFCRCRSDRERSARFWSLHRNAVIPPP
jgi:hypothetical protein